VPTPHHGKRFSFNGTSSHTFRHTFASRLTRAGADLVTVKELLRHSAVSVTMRYTHTNRDSKIRAVKLLNQSSGKVVTLHPKKKKHHSDSFGK